jgi:uncharacterized protein YjiS (DUF1127 family)
MVMTAITFDYNTAIFRSLARVIVSLPISVANAVYRSYKCHQAEAELLKMDSHLLADIGVNRGDIHNKVWGANL